MKEKLEKIVRSGKKILAGAGLISLLGTPVVVGCEEDNDSNNCTTAECCGEAYNDCIYDCSNNSCRENCIYDFNACSKKGMGSSSSGSGGSDNPSSGSSNAGGSNEGGSSGSGGNSPSCTPDCYSKDCGSDGCGGSCGSCGSNENCSSGECITEVEGCVDKCGSWGDGKCIGSVGYCCDKNGDGCLDWIKKKDCQETCTGQGYQNYECYVGSSGCVSCSCSDN